MKNEEIIDEMMCQCCSSRKKCMKDAEERCSEYGDGLDLLNEKDRQFKEYLEKRITQDIKNQNDAIDAGDKDAAFFFSARVQAYESIINELFKED